MNMYISRIARTFIKARLEQNANVKVRTWFEDEFLRFTVEYNSEVNIESELNRIKNDVQQVCCYELPVILDGRFDHEEYDNDLKERIADMLPSDIVEESDGSLYFRMFFEQINSDGFYFETILKYDFEWIPDYITPSMYPNHECFNLLKK